MALAGFAVTASTYLAATTTSSNVLIPTTGSPVTMLITNTGQVIVYFALGTSSSVAATPNAGIVVMPGASLALTIGTNTYLAAVSLPANAGVVIAVGT